MGKRKTASKLSSNKIAPDQILSEIRDAVLNSPNLDADISKIFTKYILTNNPKENAVENAVEAINGLIEKRAIANVNEKYRTSLAK